jgi:hypothetical protein
MGTWITPDFCLYYRKKFIKAVAVAVEAFTKAVTQLADGILTDVVRVRSIILESCSKVLWTYIFFVVLLILIFALNICALILISLINTLSQFVLAASSQAEGNLH